MPTSAQKKYCTLGPNWFKPARKNNGVNEYYFVNETYGFAVMAVWCVNDKQFRQCLKHYKYKGKMKSIRPLWKGGAKCVMPRKGTPYFLFFTEKDLGSIVHEAAHVVAQEMNRRDIANSSDGGDEANAYLLEWLVVQVANKMKPKILCSPSRLP